MGVFRCSLVRCVLAHSRAPRSVRTRGRGGEETGDFTAQTRLFQCFFFFSSSSSFLTSSSSSQSCFPFFSSTLVFFFSKFLFSTTPTLSFFFTKSLLSSSGKITQTCNKILSDSALSLCYIDTTILGPFTLRKVLILIVKQNNNNNNNNRKVRKRIQLQN